MKLDARKVVHHIMRATQVNNLCSIQRSKRHKLQAKHVESIPLIADIKYLVYEVNPHNGGGGEGYRYAAGNFNYHPIAKPETNQICNPYSNQIF